MRRGRLRVYVGVGPGVGTTSAAVADVRRQHERGVHVLVAVADARGRADLAAAVGELERVGQGDRLDVGEVLRRRPAIVLVDDLAASDGPDSADRADSPHAAQRWQAIEPILAEGIDVVATCEVRDVTSLTEAVAGITGRRTELTVPDTFLREADQLVIVDMPPQALRRRLAHGRLYEAEDLDASRSALFRPQVLADLREVALTWFATAVSAQHDTWLGGRRTERSASAHERIVVGLSAQRGGDRVLARAARVAGSTPGAELIAVHVLAGRPESSPADEVEPLREAGVSVGARYLQVIGDDVAEALVEVAESEGATQLFVGRRSQRSAGLPWARLFRDSGSTSSRIADAARGVDVHVVPLPIGGADSTLPRARRGVSRWRLTAGYVSAVLLPALLTGALLALGESIGLALDSLILLLAVVVTALIGGLWPAVAGAVVASTLLNFFFIPPVRSFRVGEFHNLVTLVVFVVAGVLVGTVVHRAAIEAAHAARASAESATLSAIAGGVIRGESALPALLEQLRASFGMTAVSLLRQADGWHTVQSCGLDPPHGPQEADVVVPAGEGLVLALSGRALTAADRSLLSLFAAQAHDLLEVDSLRRRAAVAERLTATERLRDALLAAVGHDLRTPLASATAAVSSLRNHDVPWSDQEREELLTTADASLDRLRRLVEDLLDLSRLQAGAMRVASEPVWMDEVAAPALDELGSSADDVILRLPDDVPPARADAALVTRILVNVIANGLRYAPAGHPLVVSASATADHVEVRVIDRGPGIPREDLPAVFTPFQRLGDRDNRAGLGLGLALSRGLAEAMQGTLEAEETPGGGTTMVLRLPVASNVEVQTDGQEDA